MALLYGILPDDGGYDDQRADWTDDLEVVLDEKTTLEGDMIRRARNGGR